MKLQKFNTRGGARTPTKAKTAQQLVIQFIITHFGGATKLARLISKLDGKEVSQQLPVNWRLRGRVPLETVGEVSRTIGIDKFALNYEQCASFVGHAPAWEDVVAALPFSDTLKKRILNAKAPNQLYSKYPHVSILSKPVAGLLNYEKSEFDEW